MEPPETPLSNPKLAEEYPFILTTGHRSPAYFHSEYRQLPWLRSIQPDPIVELSPEAAKEIGVEDGDWVWIETPRGRVKQRVKVVPGMHPKVVSAQHGWWFPEKPGPEHGCFESNINVVTSSEPPYDPCFGAVTFNALLCRVYKAEG